MYVNILTYISINTFKFLKTCLSNLKKMLQFNFLLQLGIWGRVQNCLVYSQWLQLERAAESEELPDSARQLTLGWVQSSPVATEK